MSNTPALPSEEFRRQLLQVIKTKEGRTIVLREIGKITGKLAVKGVTKEQLAAKGLNAAKVRWASVRAARECARQSEERVA